MTTMIITVEPGGDGNNTSAGIGSVPVFTEYYGGTFVCNSGSNGGTGGAMYYYPLPGYATGCGGSGYSGLGERYNEDLNYNSTSNVIVTYYLYN